MPSMVSPCPHTPPCPPPGPCLPDSLRVRQAGTQQTPQQAPPPQAPPQAPQQAPPPQAPQQAPPPQAPPQAPQQAPPPQAPQQAPPPQAPPQAPQPTTPPAATPGGRNADAGALPGYEVAASFIRKFAGTMGGSAEGVRRLGDATPRFQGWNLAPLAGVPIVGLTAVHRFNAVSDTWSSAAGILGDALHTDGETLLRAADNYVAAEQASTAAIQQTRP
ncbi:hypothetical protein AB0C14_08645 [Microbispora hainanensis]|uniref:hypothetical protein n=1 Tax=Microbispora hainanensis TaxID=568844 RepID=UPI0033C396DE